MILNYTKAAAKAVSKKNLFIGKKYWENTCEVGHKIHEATKLFYI